jgi:hypothetical protein
MNRFDSYEEFSRYDEVSSIEIPKNEITTRGLIALGVVLLGLTTIVGGYMISGLEQIPTSFMILNFFIWVSSLAIILFGYNKRNI